MDRRNSEYGNTHIEFKIQHFALQKIKPMGKKKEFPPSPPKAAIKVKIQENLKNKNSAWKF